MWVATALMGRLAGRGGPVRAAAALAAGLSARLLLGRRCAGRDDRGGVGIAGLVGSVAIALFAVIFSLPAWGA